MRTPAHSRQYRFHSSGSGGGAGWRTRFTQRVTYRPINIPVHKPMTIHPIKRICGICQDLSNQSLKDQAAIAMDANIQSGKNEFIWDRPFSIRVRAQIGE